MSKMVKASDSNNSKQRQEKSPYYTMDQDAFRILLTSSGLRPSVNRTNPSGKPQKATSAASSEPTFKPRKVKKSESKYRDRAAERREGIGNDYAEVEGVLEDFERRAAHEVTDTDAIEQQRKYLGGDSQYTILVKGLDMSLLEQNRARAAGATEDDEILEQAFAEASSKSEPIESKKRTREEIVRDLKAKRQDRDNLTNQPVVEKSSEDSLEVAKKVGKFRPIGFRPIGETEEKLKKRKVKGGKEGVKKKRLKMESTAVQSGANDQSGASEETFAISQKPDVIEPSSSKLSRKPLEPEPAPLDEDFDIFAGAGDYQGFQDDEGSDSEEGHRDMGKTRIETPDVSPIPLVGTKGWFGEPEPEVRQPSAPPEKSPPPAETTATEESQGIRLEPLESSALPSIRDFLAMDEAAEKVEKRKARKEKKKRKKTTGGDDDD